MSTENTPSLLNLRELCIRMRELQDAKEQLEEQTKRINDELDSLRLRQIPELMEALEVKTSTFEGVGRVQLAADLYCSTKAGQKEAAMQWLRDMGLDDMIQEQYNASSMKALVRRLIEDGTEIPDFMAVTPFMRASIVRSAG